MSALQKHTVIDGIKLDIARIERAAISAQPAFLPFCIHPLDQHLPGNGLALGSLHEFSGGTDFVHDAAAILMVAGIAARLNGAVLWCLKSHDLFTPSLDGVGIRPDQIVYAEVRDDKTALNVMEEGLRQAGLSAVVGEVGRLSLTASRRLHLAARAMGCTAFVIHRKSRFKNQTIDEPTAAMTRWRVSSVPSTPLPVAGVGRGRWLIELLRCRDAEPASWEMEACDATGYLSLPADLANRLAEKTPAERISA